MHTKSSANPNSGQTGEPGLRKYSKARPIAKQVGIHPKTLVRWAEQGRLHRYKLNARVVVFDEAEVAALIASSRV